MKLIFLFTDILLWVGAPIIGYVIAPPTALGRGVMIGICLFMVLMLTVARRLTLRRLRNAEIIEKVVAWQAAGFVHELTCRINSQHEALVAEERRFRVVLVCKTCGHIQDWIPEVVLGDALELQRAGLKKLGLIQ